MSATCFLITPPFTQLNTPYPATAYLKGFLNTKGITAFQADLGIEVTLQLFSKNGLQKIFYEVEKAIAPLSGNARRILALKDDYIHSIDDVILFLQGHNPTLAHLICKRSFLPEAGRFAQIDDLDWAFGSMGTQDEAKHLATMYLEDLSDLIIECVDSHFGFSRYAERMGRSANSFDELYAAMQQPFTFIDALLISILQKHIQDVQPKLLCVSVPFPGNLYSALRCGQYIKKHHPHIKIAMGGGFPNTELRSLTDVRVFEFFDFITLDDGESPIENLVRFVQGEIGFSQLKRTFVSLFNSSPNPSDGEAKKAVTFINNPSVKDYRQGEVGTPDYSDLLLDTYISAVEVINPMHRLWSDGRWNKLTMAHGCYWGKCTFCDISLDYIKLYEPVAASLLCDRMAQIIAQTGQNGFHFVDEAAPPALMRALSLEILRRKMTVTWWTNIRFEKSFTSDLCLLLKAAGCIAVSGGLEVASDRLLALIQKGITVAQVARVNRNFTEAGIMIHAYLMYGFPTQTAQETIDSLEMVRQLFANGILQSGFWHQFAMTAHSPVGLYPEKFNVKAVTSGLPAFANNDIIHEDPTGANHESFSFGLKKSLLNYMNGLCVDDPLQNWFDCKIPRTKVPPGFIANALAEEDFTPAKPTAKVVWLGKKPIMSYFTKSKKGVSWVNASLTIYSKTGTTEMVVGEAEGAWLTQMLEKLSVTNLKTYTWQEVKDDYEQAGLKNLELFWFNKPVSKLRGAGLLLL